MKKLLFAVLYATGVTRLVAWANRVQVTILCYHSVTKPGSQPADDPFKLHLQLDLFIKHLEHLRSNYQIISLSEVVRARRENTKLPPRSVVLTFDDGFRNFSTVVADELLRRGLPATNFIVIDKTENHVKPQTTEHANLTDEERHLSWADVKRLARLGFEFGSHSCSHSRLLSLSLEGVRKELEDSLGALIEHLGPSRFALSYPHGQTSEDISRLAESLGYSCALTTSLGGNHANEDLFALNRTVVAADDDVATFAARVSGLTWWANRLLNFLHVSPDRSMKMMVRQYKPLVSDNLDL